MENFRGIAKNYLDKLMGIKIPKVSGYKGVLYASFGTLFGLYFLHTVAKYNGYLH